MHRIPIQNIYYILCYAWGMTDLRGKVSVGVENSPSLSDLLVHVLLNATDNVLKRGAAQGYIVCGDEVNGIKGKVNIGETLKTGRCRQGKICCQYDELTTDILINQIIYSTLLDAVKIVGLSNENKDRIAKTLRRMPQTSRIRISETVLNSVRLDRISMNYKMVLNVCMFLHQSVIPNKGMVGGLEFLDILDDERLMNRIFERFLMNFYKQECKQIYPEVSRSYIRFQLTPYGMTFAKSTDEAYSLLPLMETDVTLYNPQTRKKIILDAKYYKDTLVSKFGEKGKIRRDHLSQILSYVMNQESEMQACTKDTKGILVYPTVDIVLDVSYVYKNTNHVIKVSTVNLNQDWWQIEKRLKEIII